MKVRELTEQLAKRDPDAIVILSRDIEGNGFSPLAQIDPGDNTLAVQGFSDAAKRQLVVDASRGYCPQFAPPQ